MKVDSASAQQWLLPPAAMSEQLMSSRRSSSSTDWTQSHLGLTDWTSAESPESWTLNRHTLNTAVRTTERRGLFLTWVILGVGDSVGVQAAGGWECRHTQKWFFQFSYRQTWNNINSMLFSLTLYQTTVTYIQTSHVFTHTPHVILNY